MRTSNRKFVLAVAIVFVLSFFVSQGFGASKEEQDAKMEWWREARFGMFIHWGVYSVFGGDYENKVDLTENYVGPWILRRNRFPIAMYRKYAKQFNPVDYNPEKWVKLAKEAGMKYMVITSKHHEGFALFDSKVTDWDIVDASPYGKDLLKPLAEACKKHGIKLGFYYSQSSDWVHPGGRKPGGDWDDDHKGDMKEYVRKIAVPQVRELLTNYGDVAILWWDTPGSIPKESCYELQEVLKDHPNVITNDRLGRGKDFSGDHKTREQKIPPGGADYDWETCMTMNTGWGYNKDDHKWKSTETLLRNLVDIASKGGNYLLNVGPTAQGVIPDESVTRLKEIGKWMDANGESIYGTTANPFKEQFEWGRCTKKVSDESTVLYLHVFDWPEPEEGEIVLPGLKSKVKKAYVLADKKNLKVSSFGESVAIQVPQFAPDEINTVIALEIDGELKIDE